MPNRIEKYLQALIQQVQPTEDGLQQLIRERRLGTAVGAAIDQLAKLVGQARGGLDDESFERFIRARISANNSSGTANDVLRVVGLVIADDDATLRLEPQYPAAFTLFVTGMLVDEDLAEIVARFVRATASAAVRTTLVTSPVIPAQSLFLGDADDPLVGVPGLGDASDPSEGGRLASAI